MNIEFTPAQVSLFEHCRYKIYSHYFGVFDQKRVIAIADNIDDCNMIIKALEARYADRTFEFSYELIAPFDQIKDVSSDDIFFKEK